jgi:hypothetical protein
MPSIRQPELRKRSGVCYVVTDDGIELPVVDVTHPAFALELERAQQRALIEAFLKESQPLEKLPGPVRQLVLSVVLRGSGLARGIKRSRLGVFRELVEAAGFTIARAIERPMSDQVLLLAAEAPASDPETAGPLGE